MSCSFKLIPLSYYSSTRGILIFFMTVPLTQFCITQNLVTFSAFSSQDMDGQEEATNVSANKVSTAKLEIFHSTGVLLKVVTI